MNLSEYLYTFNIFISLLKSKFFLKIVSASQQFQFWQRVLEISNLALLKSLFSFLLFFSVLHLVSHVEGQTCAFTSAVKLR